MDHLIGAVIGVSAFVFVCWLIFMAWCWTWVLEVSNEHDL